MANRTFPLVGGHNGGNAHLANLLDTDQMGFAMTPELVFERRITWKDLRDATAIVQTDSLVVGGTIVAGLYELAFIDARTGVTLDTLEYAVHQNTVTIAGTASDGNYDVLFTALDPPVRARVTRSTTPSSNDNLATAMAAAITDLIATSLAGIVASASANTNVVTIVYEAGIDPQTLTCTETTATGTVTPSTTTSTANIATALEALIATARATTLAGYVDDESVASSTITITMEAGAQVTVTPTFPGTATGTVTIANVATLDIGITGNLFPANVMVRGGSIKVGTAFAGGTPTITAVMGDAGATNGLVTSTSIATAAFVETISAAEFTEHFEAAFVPIVTITSNRVFSSLTAGELSCMVPYTPPPTI